MKVAYDKQTVDTPNPIARFAHRKRLRVALDLVDGCAPANGTVCDFGAGTGTFLMALKERRPDLTVIAVEPYLLPNDKAITYLPSLESVAPGSQDVVTALEVCEHLSDAELAEFIQQAKITIRAGGQVLISVPVMLGLSLPLKCLNRAILFRRRPDHSFVQVARGVFGLSVARAENRSSHRGFDFRVLRTEIARDFRVTIVRRSPFRRLPWWANSQVFFRCEPGLTRPD